MKNIYSAGLEWNGTSYEDGTPCEWQWCESNVEEYGETWNGDVRGYVENMLESDSPSEITSNAFTIHNEPENAVILCDARSGYPTQMFWAVEE